MKSLLIKFLIFCGLFIVIDIGIGAVFNQMDKKVQELPIDYTTAYLKAVNVLDEDVIIFGESRARHQYVPSLISDSLGLSVINAAMDGSFMSQQSAVIQMMLQRHVPKLIIWEVDAVSLMDKWRNDELDRMGDLNPFYDQDPLSRNLIKQRGLFEGVKMLSKAYRNNNRLLGRIKVIKKGMYNDTLKGYWPVKTKGYKYPLIRDRMFDDDINEDKLELLASTINTIQKAGCPLVIINSPQYENCNLETTLQGKKFDAILEEMNVSHYNHHYDMRLLQDSTLFKDCSHLNARGVEVYMKILIPELKQTLDNANQ